MKRAVFISFLLFGGLLVLSAHPGRTDANGGHNGPNGYHYHDRAGGDSPAPRNTPPAPPPVINNEPPPRRLVPLSRNIRILQGNRPASGQDGHYTIRNGYFSFEVGYLVLDTNYIYVFASLDNNLFTRYTFPVNRDDTVFALGNGMARDRNTMIISETSGFNLIDTNDVIRNLSFVNRPSSYPAVIYLTIYGDQNKNDIIEQEEIAFITLEITGDRPGLLFPAQ